MMEEKGEMDDNTDLPTPKMGLKVLELIKLVGCTCSVHL